MRSIRYESTSARATGSDGKTAHQTGPSPGVPVHRLCRLGTPAAARIQSLRVFKFQSGNRQYRPPKSTPGPLGPKTPTRVINQIMVIDDLGAVLEDLLERHSSVLLGLRALL